MHAVAMLPLNNTFWYTVPPRARLPPPLHAVAKRLGTEEVRVDLFVNPKDPMNPIVNEIAFSSGQSPP